MLSTHERPFLCVITPIFDGCIDALKLLIAALQKQALTDFIHVMISAGSSEKCQQFIKALNDPRFIYEEHTGLKTDVIEELIASLGERRTYCFKKYEAQRYVCLDADLQIKSNDYFNQLQKHHDEADILLTKVWVWPAWPTKRNGPPTVLPKHPFARGQIDLSNFSFSKRLAIHLDCFYPTDLGSYGGRDGDWRFFEILTAKSECFRKDNFVVIPIISAVYNGNSTYPSISSQIGS